MGFSESYMYERYEGFVAQIKGMSEEPDSSFTWLDLLDEIKEALHDGEISGNQYDDLLEEMENAGFNPFA